MSKRFILPVAAGLKKCIMSYNRIHFLKVDRGDCLRSNSWTRVQYGGLESKVVTSSWSCDLEPKVDKISLIIFNSKG